MTIGMGSLLAGASQSSDWPGLLQTLVAMASLFIVQYSVANIRQKSKRFDELVQNTPVILMKDGLIMYDALRKTRVSEEDLIAKLREANARDFSEVRAVVLETTGDISVLHGEHLNEQILKGVGQ